MVAAKRELRRISILYWKWEETVTKVEGRAKVLNAFFASVLNRKTNCSLGIHHPETEDRDGENNEAPVIQGEMAMTCYVT